MTRRAATLGLAAVLLLSGCAGGSASSTPSVAAAEFHGVEPEPVPVRPSFVLRTTSGERYDFEERTGGRPTLLYFGYTNCPDECPTAMADISAALRSTPPELRDQVEVVFVTTDPERDTPPVLRSWLDGFSTKYVGLLGTQAEVDAAQKATGIAAAKRADRCPRCPAVRTSTRTRRGRPLTATTGPLDTVWGTPT